jgi:hypothetical protein
MCDRLMMMMMMGHRGLVSDVVVGGGVVVAMCVALAEGRRRASPSTMHCRHCSYDQVIAQGQRQAARVKQAYDDFWISSATKCCDHYSSVAFHSVVVDKS